MKVARLNIGGIYSRELTLRRGQGEGWLRRKLTRGDWLVCDNGEHVAGRAVTSFTIKATRR